MKLKLKKHKQTNEAQQLFILFLTGYSYVWIVVHTWISFTSGWIWFLFHSRWFLYWHISLPFFTRCRLVIVLLCLMVIILLRLCLMVLIYSGHQCQVLRRAKIYRQLNCHLLLIWMPPTECIFIHSCIHVYIYMLILRVIRIIWMYCAFSHVCNKMVTKIKYTLNHHEFVCQRMN